MITDSSRAFARSRWFMLAICLFLGGVSVLVSWLGGQLATGLIGLAILAGFGLFIALAGGSATIRGLRGDGRDERFAQIDLRACRRPSALARLTSGGLVAAKHFDISMNASCATYATLVIERACATTPRTGAR